MLNPLSLKTNVFGEQIWHNVKFAKNYIQTFLAYLAMLNVHPLADSSAKFSRPSETAVNDEPDLFEQVNISPTSTNLNPFIFSRLISMLWRNTANRYWPRILTHHTKDQQSWTKRK